MRSYKTIRNLEDLQAKKLELKVEYTLKQSMLKSDGKAFINRFTLGSLIKKIRYPKQTYLRLMTNLTSAEQ